MLSPAGLVQPLTVPGSHVGLLTEVPVTLPEVLCEEALPIYRTDL